MDETGRLNIVCKHKNIFFYYFDCLLETNRKPTGLIDYYIWSHFLYWLLVICWFFVKFEFSFRWCCYVVIIQIICLFFSFVLFLNNEVVVEIFFIIMLKSKKTKY